MFRRWSDRTHLVSEDVEIPSLADVSVRPLEKGHCCGTGIINNFFFLAWEKYPEECSIPFALVTASLNNLLKANLFSQVTWGECWLIMYPSLRASLGRSWEPSQISLRLQIQGLRLQVWEPMLHTLVFLIVQDFWTLFWSITVKGRVNVVTWQDRKGKDGE